MARKALTDLDCKNAKCPTGRMDIFDATTPGLCLRVTANKKTWTFFYSPPGSKERARLGLGTYPSTTLDAARKRAVQARGQVEAGTDPRAVQVAATGTAKTISQLIDERMEMVVRPKHRRADEVEWRYKKYVIPYIGNVAVQDFRIDPHYNRVIDPLVKRGKTRMAGVVHTDLTALFTFAIRRGVVEFSRMAATENPFEYVPCKRWLTAAEIKTLWASLPTALPGTESTQQALRLMLATGQRSNEVVGITRDELDMKNAIWTLPAARSKNGHEHVVPLNALAMALIREALRKSNGPFLFPRKDGERSRTSCDISTAVDYARLRKVENPLGLFGIAYWTPHDLRRTVGTHLSLLGVSDADIGHVLNHRTTTKNTVTQQVYNQNTYLREKREALDKWGAFLSKLVGVQQQLMAAE